LPEPLRKFLAGDQLAGALQQALEHLEGLLLEVHTHVGLPQLAGASVQLECAKPHHSTAGSGCLAHVPPLKWGHSTPRIGYAAPRQPSLAWITSALRLANFCFRCTS